MGWLRDLVRKPPRLLPVEVLWACPSERRPWGRPRTRRRDYISWLTWERLSVLPEELLEVSGDECHWSSLIVLLLP